MFCEISCCYSIYHLWLGRTTLSNIRCPDAFFFFCLKKELPPDLEHYFVLYIFSQPYPLQKVFSCEFLRQIRLATISEHQLRTAIWCSILGQSYAQNVNSTALYIFMMVVVVYWYLYFLKEHVSSRSDKPVLPAGTKVRFKLFLLIVIIGKWQQVAVLAIPFV